MDDRTFASLAVAMNATKRRLRSASRHEKRLRHELAQKRGLRTSFGSGPVLQSRTHGASLTRNTPSVGRGSFDMEWVDAYVDYWEAMGRPGYGWSD